MKSSDSTCSKEDKAQEEPENKQLREAVKEDIKWGLMKTKNKIKHL